MKPRDVWLAIAVGLAVAAAGLAMFLIASAVVPGLIRAGSGT